MLVLKKPVRMAYKELNFSPLRNKGVPRLTFRRTATISSMRFKSGSLNPMGMHNSRRLQLEQATLMAVGFIG